MEVLAGEMSAKTHRNGPKETKLATDGHKAEVKPGMEGFCSEKKAFLQKKIDASFSSILLPS